MIGRNLIWQTENHFRGYRLVGQSFRLRQVGPSFMQKRPRRLKRSQ